MIRMLSEVDGRSPAFTYFFFDFVAGDRGADQLFSRHAAKLIETAKAG
jgi:hypothetical protein